MRFNKKMFVWMSIFVSFLLIGTYAVAKNNWITDPEVNAPSISSIVIPGPKKPPKPHKPKKLGKPKKPGKPGRHRH